MIDEVITERYVFKIIYTDGTEQEFEHGGIYASVKQRYLWFKENKEITKVFVFKLIQQQLDTSDWSNL